MRVLFLFIFFCFSVCVSAQPIFQRTYAGFLTLYGHGDAGIQTSDGGYIITGEINNFPNPDVTNVTLIKTNLSGDTVWVKNYDGSNSNSETGLDIKETRDGGYIITGWTQSFGAGGKDVLLMKVDSAGNCLWAKAFGTSASNEVGNCVEQTIDGGYIIASGFPHEYGTGTIVDKATLIKIDSLGSLSWTKTFTGTSSATGNSVVQTSDGGFVMVGTAVTALGQDVLLIKTDSLGNTLWTKSIDDGENETGYSLAKTQDNGFIISGEAAIGGSYSDVYLLKVDSLGNAIWSRKYGSPTRDEGVSVFVTSDGGFAVAGTYNINGAAGNDVYLLKTDASGNILWERTFGFTNSDRGRSVVETSDGGYMVVGFLSGGNTYSYFIKTNSFGNSAGCFQSTPVSAFSIENPISSGITLSVSSPFLSNNGVMYTTYKGNRYIQCYSSGTVDVEEEKNDPEIILYPNPTSDILNIKCSENINSYSIYDMLGRKMLNGFGNIVNLQKIQPGIYLLNVIFENENCKNLTFIKE